MSCYIVQEIDGTSRFTLEDASGFLLLESCVSGVELPPGLGAVTQGLPPMSARRRIYQDVVTDEEDVLTIILLTLDE